MKTYEFVCAGCRSATHRVLSEVDADVDQTCQTTRQTRNEEGIAENSTCGEVLLKVGEAKSPLDPVRRNELHAYLNEHYPAPAKRNL